MSWKFCHIIVSEFEPQSRYYVHFHTNTIGKGKNALISSGYGLNNISTVGQQRWLWHWTMMADMPQKKERKKETKKLVEKSIAAKCRYNG